MIQLGPLLHPAETNWVVMKTNPSSEEYLQDDQSNALHVLIVVSCKALIASVYLFQRHNVLTALTSATHSVGIQYKPNKYIT